MSSVYLIVTLDDLMEKIDEYCKLKQLTITSTSINTKTTIIFRSIQHGSCTLDIFNQKIGVKINPQGKAQVIIFELIDGLKKNEQYCPTSITTKKLYCIPKILFENFISDYASKTQNHTQYHRKHTIFNEFQHHITIDEHNQKKSDYLNLTINGHQRPYETFEYELFKLLNIQTSGLIQVFPEIFEDLEKSSISSLEVIAQRFHDEHESELKSLDPKMKELLILGLRFTESSLNISEYSFILFLFFRPIESLLREIIEDNIKPSYGWNFGEIFEYNKSTHKWTLNRDYTNLFSIEQTYILEDSYLFFNKNRNQSAHSPSVFQSSYFCDTIEKAREISLKALGHIKNLHSIR